MYSVDTCTNTCIYMYMYARHNYCVLFFVNLYYKHVKEVKVNVHVPTHCLILTFFFNLSLPLPSLPPSPFLPSLTPSPSLPPSLSLPPLTKVISPLVTRAQIVKGELSDTEGLKYKIEEKGKETLELKKTIKLKGQEMGEVNVKVDLLEKKLEMADAEVCIMRLHVLNMCALCVCVL